MMKMRREKSLSEIKYRKPISVKELEADTQVVLINDRYLKIASRSNPVIGSGVEVSGRVAYNPEGNAVHVDWFNGASNVYDWRDLGIFIENEEDAATRSIFTLNSDITVGNITLLSKGTMMYSTNGEYLNDLNGKIFIKVSDSNELKSKRIFSKRK
jgi:hypothetical protein